MEISPVECNEQRMIIPQELLFFLNQPMEFYGRDKILLHSVSVKFCYIL